MVLPHARRLEGTPPRLVGVRLEGAFERPDERLGRVLGENEARFALAHGIGESANRPDYRNRAVAQAVHLIEAAWLELRGHEEGVGSAFDEMRKRLVEADSRGDARRVLRRKIAPHVFISRLARAEDDVG